MLDARAHRVMKISAQVIFVHRILTPGVGRNVRGVGVGVGGAGLGLRLHVKRQTEDSELEAHIGLFRPSIRYPALLSAPFIQFACPTKPI